MTFMPLRLQIYCRENLSLRKNEQLIMKKSMENESLNKINPNSLIKSEHGKTVLDFFQASLHMQLISRVCVCVLAFAFSFLVTSVLVNSSFLFSCLFISVFGI